ncbi:hypothetical protein COY27_06175 [Candidatus Woesearchaeota archaeon CG_4_10_14_0_2_um_filter_33_13]|nr:MAG: hypothetical protein COY27_06175 [Candidatus Woesearchaeota archaeon CG_4_10_14_0_2_um_filter_33_13]
MNLATIDKNQTDSIMFSKKMMTNSSLSTVRKLFRPKSFQIKTRIIENGMRIQFKRGAQENYFDLTFPMAVWQDFPQDYKILIKDNLAYLSSLELGIMFDAKKIRYDTPLPLFKSFFIELMLRCLIYSGDCDDKANAVDYITRLCNLDYTFTKSKPPIINSEFSLGERSINTFTFGKESLLGFGLSKEIGLNPAPVTIVEPDVDIIYNGISVRTFENKHKEKLIAEFEKEFQEKIQVVYNHSRDLLDYTLWGLEETDLGWSNQLTQYLFFLLPFAYSLKGKYIVFGNEKSADSHYYSSEGFKCNPVYDQSAEWLAQMNSLLHITTKGKVRTTSLVQPLHELAVCKVLYQRYPHLAKYQMSCHADNDGAEHNRWCCQCSKCARCYIFMKALNFDPISVGMKDMLTIENKEHYALFSESKELRGYDLSGLGRDEQLFAFYLAAKNGAQGTLIDLFKENLYVEAESREEELRNEFLKVHLPENIPTELWKKIKPIFDEELKKN